MAEPSLVATSIIPPLPRSVRGCASKIDASLKGDLIAYPSAKVVTLLRSADFAVVHIYREHSCNTTAVRFSANGELIASGDEKGEVKVWQSSAPFTRLHKFKSYKDVVDIAWCPDGLKIAIAGLQPVYIELKHGSSEADLTGHNRRIESVAIHPDVRKRMIIMASQDSQVSVFDISNGGYRPKWSKTLNHHTKHLNSVSFNEDGSLFASGGGDGQVVVYDTSTKLKITNRQHDRSITSTVFLSLPAHDDGDTVDGSKKEILVYASTDGTIRALHCGEGVSIVDDWTVEDKGLQRLALAASPSTRCLFVVNSTERLDKLRASDGSLVSSLHGHKGHLKAIDIADGTTVTGDNSGHLCIDRGQGVESFGYKNSIVFGEENSNAVRGLSILGEEQEVICLRLKNVMEIFSLSDGSLLSSHPLSSEPRSISKGRNKLAVRCHEEILIVDRETKGLSEKLSIETTSMSLHPDGTHFAIGVKTGDVTEYSITESPPTIVHSFTVKGPVAAMEYSPDGVYLAVADGDRYVRVYRREGWALLVDNWRDHSATIRTIGWSPDGKALATGGVDGLLIVWRLPEENEKFDPIIQKSGHMPEALIWRSHSEVVTVGEDGCRIHWKVEE